MISDEQLFSAYQKLWVNRSFSNQDNLSVKEKLSYAIQKDLRDEMTHPRVRKSPEVKYELVPFSGLTIAVLLIANSWL
ncbi:hypothetical protein OC195_18235 [Priestia flexa]|nr:hypothetical protein OC195_18235 [Priestia flexa]